MARKPYVKPAARKIDPQGTEGKLLLAKLQARERRRSQRVMLQMHVQFHRFMPDGRVLRQAALTQVVSGHGGLVRMEAALEVGQRVTLVNPSSGVQQSSTVVGVRRSREGGYAVAVEFDGPAPQFWSPVVPPEDSGITHE